MTETNEPLTLAVMLEAKRLAKEAQSAIQCSVCGLAGVANEPDALIQFREGQPVQFVHAHCCETERD